MGLEVDGDGPSAIVRLVGAATDEGGAVEFAFAGSIH